MVGPEADKPPRSELVSKLNAKREELKRASTPRQITGRQLASVIRTYFRVDDAQVTTFELTALLNITYPGDARLGQFKDKWDHVVRNLRSPISDRDLEGILVTKLRGSELLAPHLVYYDRLPRGHADRSYAWVSQLIDTIVESEREKRNTESLILDVSGKEQPAAQNRKQAMPATTTTDQQPQQQQTQQPPQQQTASGGYATTPTGGRKGRQARGNTSPSSSAQNSPSGTPRAMKGITASDRCCIKHLWGKCQMGDNCKYGPHRTFDVVPESIQNHTFYKTLSREHGPPPTTTTPSAGNVRDAASPAVSADGPQ